MAYRIEAIELYVRETLPGRMLFTLGKQGAKGSKPKRLANPLAHVRMVIRETSGQETFGCSGDRLSVRWLDKRPGRDTNLKRRELVALVEQARDIWLSHREFDSPFDQWRRCHTEVMKAGRAAKQEDLTSAFASAIMERAMLDGVSRLAGKSIYQMVQGERLGFQPAAIHPEVGKLKFPHVIAPRPLTRFSIRHTVGLADPLTKNDLPGDQRVNDGLPETLEEYIKTDGVRFFKIKISGDPTADIERLQRIWGVISRAEQPVITLDANEAYADLKTFAKFVKQLEKENVGLFQHIEYIEQPLPRQLTLDPKTSTDLKKIAESKRLLIDEADGTLDAYRRAHAIGYLGTSHKNCKGVFKSLANHALAVHYALKGEDAFLSAEDLQNISVVPLHQDFATLGILGIEHCERNGHHYNRGLSMLSPKDKANAVKHHPDMYVQRGDEWFLDVRDGMVRCASLQCPGFGVSDEPDWPSMMPMRKWVRSRHPA